MPWAAFAAPGQGSLDKSDFDPSVKIEQDFYQYATGGWQKKNPIPEDKPRWGTFNALAESNLQVQHDILEGLAANRQIKGSIEQKLADFYATGMDIDAVENARLKPLVEEFARIGAIKSKEDLELQVIRLQLRGINPYFNFGSTQDARDSTQVIGEATQGGLGLPDRDYYFRDDEASKKIRAAYLQYIDKLFRYMGDDKATAKANAKTVMALETRLAKASKTKVEMRDSEGVYNRLTLEQLQALTPHWDWPLYFRQMGLKGIESINVTAPDFFKSADREWNGSGLTAQKTYLRFTLVNELAASLPNRFVNAHFDFYGKALTGSPKIQPRWKRIVSATDGALGFALGKKFVEKKFSPEAKARAEEMVKRLRATLAEDIKTLPWMSEPTKEKALAKLAKIDQKIGYPDKWRDYSRLIIRRESYMDNVLAAQEFLVRRDLDKIGKPVDRNEWYMTPQTVNAYYSQSTNEIVFPAGILQPPFFSETYDDALNYGAMGMVIGHELTHGFDDQGSQYDADGNLKDWWTPEDKAAFDALAKNVVDQFSGYTIVGGQHLNGELVQGESIADLGGLKIAYKAFRSAFEENPYGEIDGLTPDQRFFLSYARIWAMNMRPEYERLQVNTDPHPHPRYRVNGPLSNMEEFQKAFNLPDGSPMVRNPRNRIW
jgi:putative endopeptidase